MQEWDELLNDDLWDSFRTEFVEWIDENFKLASITIQKKLRTFLRSRNVWVIKSSKLIIAKSFAQVVKKDTFTSWTEEEIRRCLTSKTFVFHVINHLLKTNFDRDSKNYSWRTSSSRSESRHSESRQSESHKSTESGISFISKSSSRERSVQEKLVTRQMQQSLIRSFRESSITRNFLRQSLSSSSQSEVQEISEISENLYKENSYNNSSLSQSKNLYIRQSEKKSMLRQSFRSRFSKFYQSSELSEQFYKRSTVYSSFVSSRSLFHEYS
jgi:hypothetical protein